MGFQQETLCVTSLELNVSFNGLEYNEMFKYRKLSYCIFHCDIYAATKIQLLNCVTYHLLLTLGS